MSKKPLAGPPEGTRGATDATPGPAGSEAGSAPAQGPECPVIGIGCSAGGLEALERFLTHMPPDAGAAVVIVQHLAPNHASALPELLQRFTKMLVVEAREGMPIRPDTVHIIPPNHDLALRDNQLHLVRLVGGRGPHLSVDHFLQSLAQDRKDAAIGIVLSGMGSDGTVGLQAIKQHGGLTLVQDPASAQADSMPRSALQAGTADIVTLPEDMPAHIVEALRARLRLAQANPPSEAGALDAMADVLALLRTRSGNDFSLYKSNSLQRRMERRLAVHTLTSVAAYANLLRSNPAELDLLFKELLIGVTSFFRDDLVWQTLGSVTLPALLAEHPQGKALRAWVAACSTGEEAYSLAIAFKEALDHLQPQARARFSLQVYATDLDRDAIDTARKAQYPPGIAARVSEQRLARFFVREDGGRYRVGKEIREMVVFATQNVILDPPFTRLDLLSCRNLLIYFEPQVQKKLMPLFFYALNPGGLLLLGSAETTGHHAHLFATLDHKARIYRRLDRALPITDVDFPGRMALATLQPRLPPMTQRPDNLAELTDQLVQQTWAPPAVLVNAEGDILYFSGRTGKYLEPAAGRTNVNIHAMAREGLREALVGVVSKALREPHPVLLNGLRVGTNGGRQTVDVVVQGIDKPDALRGRVLIVFKDRPAVAVRRSKAGQAAADDGGTMALELQQTREALQVTHEEMQTTVEELKSSNEELQSTNEELQSTNEELTTSKEELQSINDELQTVNAELQSKVDDLNWVRNDMTNLLNSIEIPTIFLDGQMNVRRFTTHANKIFRLIPGDVGRPLVHVTSDLDYPQLIADADEVLRTLVFKETVVGTHDGRSYRVRVMPYRTQANVIDGVVATFTDVTTIKLLEAQLRSVPGHLPAKD